MPRVDPGRLRRDPMGVAGDVVRAIGKYGVETPLCLQALNILVFVFGSVVAAGGFLSLHNYAQTQAQRDFQHPAREIAAILTDAVDRHVKVAGESVALFGGEGPSPNRWAFFEHARKTLLANPGVQAIEWIPRVPHQQRRILERSATDDGLFRFSFFDRTNEKARISAPRRDEYYPVFYVEPYPGNEEVLGYDLSGDLDAFSVLKRARDTGRMTAEPLDQSKKRLKHNPGFVLLMPVYRTEVLPFTVQERRRELKGFVRVVLRLDRIVAQLRTNLSVPPGYGVAFFGEKEGARARFIHFDSMEPGAARTGVAADAANPTGVNFTQVYDLLDWRLNIVILPVANIIMRNITSAAWVFAVFTLSMTALLLLYLVTSQTRSREVEKSVADRTASLESEIERRVTIEKHLREVTDQAESANRAKSEFLAMMSHELRTPLNAVIGFSEMMTNAVFGPLGHEKYNTYAEYIANSASHLLSLINDILDLSKIEAEKYDLHKELVPIAGLWKGVQTMLRDKITDARLEVESNLEASPIIVWADRRAFYQILLNLLSNAIKFTPAGGKISVNAETDSANRLVVVVSDTGIGIPAGSLESVFEPFKQLESSLERSFEGTGLGLPLTRRLVELHGGRLEIQSEVNRGTVVTMTFGEEIFRAETTGNSDRVESIQRIGAASVEEKHAAS